MLLLGYILAVLIGVSLGVTGSGGAILTVPLLVYLFSLSPTLATSYSLFIVGATSLVGSITNIHNRTIDLKTVLFFGVFSTVAVYSIRVFLVPYIPEKIIETDHFTITYASLIMILLSCFMIVSALSTMRIRETATQPNFTKSQQFGRIMLSGLIVGSITGFLGIGGGFIVVPALVFLIRLPIKKAIGTSLCIITINSFVGFFTIADNQIINWNIIISIAGVSIVGIWLGSHYVKKASLIQLKSYIGWFILTIGLSIIIKELTTQFLF